MKNLIKFIIIFSILSTPVQAACDFLIDIGVNVSEIDPRKIQIYGNGGAMLPEHNALFRYDDLVENPIRVVGEEDGSFDQNDFITIKYVFRKFAYLPLGKVMFFLRSYSVNHDLLYYASDDESFVFGTIISNEGSH